MGVVVRLKQVDQKKIDDFFFVFVDSRRLLFEPSKSQYFFSFNFSSQYQILHITLCVIRSGGYRYDRKSAKATNNEMQSNRSNSKQFHRLYKICEQFEKYITKIGL